MLTIQDCIELSELNEDEILAIAEHEHVPEMVALEMGNYLLHRPDGETCIKGIILDLRNNPGGLLDQAVSVSDFFLSKGRIVTIKPEGGKV